MYDCVYDELTLLVFGSNHESSDKPSVKLVMDEPKRNDDDDDDENKGVRLKCLVQVSTTRRERETTKPTTRET